MITGAKCKYKAEFYCATVFNYFIANQSCVSQIQISSSDYCRKTTRGHKQDLPIFRTLTSGWTLMKNQDPFQPEPFYDLCCHALHFLQYFHFSVVQPRAGQSSPGMASPGKDHLFWPAGDSLPNTAKNSVSLLSNWDKLMTHVHFSVYEDSQILFCRVAYQSVLVSGVVPVQVQFSLLNCTAYCFPSNRHPFVWSPRKNAILNFILNKWLNWTSTSWYFLSSNYWWSFGVVWRQHWELKAVMYFA